MTGGGHDSRSTLFLSKATLVRSDAEVVELFDDAATDMIDDEDGRKMKKTDNDLTLHEQILKRTK